MDENFREIAEELLRRQSDEACQFFEPNGAQERFIRAVGEEKAQTLIFDAANGVGKDCVAQNILANIIWGPQNKWFKGLKLFENWPYPKHLRIVTEPKLVEASGPIDTEIRNWWPKERYIGTHGTKHYISQYKTDNGFYVDKMTYEQQDKEFEGVTCGCILFSEPPPQAIYQACVGRLRKGGIIMIVMTPLSSAEWIWDELIGKPNVHLLGPIDIEENCIDHGVRGVLRHADIEKMIANWDPEEREARAHGRPIHFKNVILGNNFQQEWHVIDNTVLPPHGAQWGYTVDPHGSKPFAIGYWWVSPTGQIVFDHEYPVEDWTRVKQSQMVLDDYANVWRQWEKGRVINQRIIDRHFANSRDYRGMTLRQELDQKHKLWFENSYNMEDEIEQGILKVKQFLAFNRSKPIDTVNQPRLLIKRQCFNIIRSLERWKRKDNGHPDPDSKYKDHFDVVRHTVMAEPKIKITQSLPSRKVRYAPGN